MSTITKPSDDQGNTASPWVSKGKPPKVANTEGVDMMAALKADLGQANLLSQPAKAKPKPARPSFDDDFEYHDNDGDQYISPRKVKVVPSPYVGLSYGGIHGGPIGAPEAMVPGSIQPAGVAMPAPPPPIAAAPDIRTESLKSFVAGPVDFKDSTWTYDKVMDAINTDGWRARDIDETVREGDILCVATESNPRFERVEGWKDIVLTQELIDIHNGTIYTLEGGGKKRKKPLFDKSTTDFKSIYDVPRHVQLKLPIDENEAKRFFGCDVIVTEVMEKGKYVKAFYPTLNKLAERRFRVIFSRIFVEFAKKYCREHIKGLIPGRGDGIKLKRNVSTKKILSAIQNGKTIDTVCAETNTNPDTIIALLTKNDYHPKDSAFVFPPLITFQDRMGARQLTPGDFRYDKALGLEIETLCPVNREKAQKVMPSYVRTTDDGSIKDKDGNPPNQKTQWGVEFRILMKRSEMETRALRVCDALKAIGCKVNKTCGMHVHIDMRGRPESEVVKLHDKLNKWLSALRELIPPSRRANKYCAFENPEKAHWAAVSIDAYKRHKTLEVRVHSATLNHIKIIQWVRLIETIIQMKFPPLPKTSTMDALKMLGMMEADNTYWLKRHHQLNESLYKDGKLKDLSFLGDTPHEDE